MTANQELDEFLAIRTPGAHLEDDVVDDDFVLMLGVDLENYPRFPKAVEDGVTFPKAQLDPEYVPVALTSKPSRP